MTAPADLAREYRAARAAAAERIADCPPRSIPIGDWHFLDRTRPAADRREAGGALSAPAANALASLGAVSMRHGMATWRRENAEIAYAKTLGDLADRSRRQMLSVPGVGPSMLRQIGASLARAGVPTEWEPPPPPGDCPHCGRPMPATE